MPICIVYYVLHVPCSLCCILIERKHERYMLGKKE